MSILYKCFDHIEIMEMDHEWIVMDTEGFTITKINSMGASILNNIKEHKNIEEIVEWIHLKYDVDLEVAQNDTYAFLGELIKIGLITHART